MRTIDSFDFFGTDKVYSTELSRVVRKALKGLNKAFACTAVSLGAYLKSPVFGEAPRLVRISRARGSKRGTRLIRTEIVLLGRARYYSYVSRFNLRVCDCSANTAPNSEVHPNATLAADGTPDVEGVVRAAAKEFLGHQSSPTYKKGKGTALFAFCLEHNPDFAMFILERADLDTRQDSSTEGAVALFINRKALTHFLKDRIKDLRRRGCRRDPVSGHHPH